GNAKTFTRSIEKISLQIFGESVSDAMDQNVDAFVVLLQVRGQALDFRVVVGIALKTFCAGQRGDELAGFFLKALILIGDSESGAGIGQALGNSPGNAAFICQTRYDRIASLQAEHRCKTSQVGNRTG